MKKNLLSIIVPAYKQEKTIFFDLLSISKELENRKIDYEIICVVDGFVDHTFEEAQKATRKDHKIKVLGYEKNRGKGYAVKYGFENANGELIGFIDAGMDINPRGIPLLLEHMLWYDSDVIVGSIRHSASKVNNYPLKRKILSIGYHFLTKILFGLKVTDTQRGIKIFKREVLEQVLPRLTVSGFSFDIEMLSLARRLGYEKIHDGPVEMDASKMKYSSVHLQTVFKMLLETIGIFYRLNFLNFYNLKKKIIFPKDNSNYKPLISIIIPVRTATNYLKETIEKLKNQTYKNFELIVITDRPEKIKDAKVFASDESTPSYKRNLGVQKSKGEILAFLDDDSYPETYWLENAVKIFNREKTEDKKIVGVCGPCLTPEMDSDRQKAAGYVLSTLLGSGGAGIYRNRIMSEREVDDFPSVNLLVRRDDFLSVGGFDINHWPGEDTKLCLELIKRGAIVYNPGVLVYHHRRPVFLPFLKQISRYARRRGFFARNFPETSFRIGYFFPSFFTFTLIFLSFASLFFQFFLPFLIFFILLYLLLLFITGIEIYLNEKKLKITFLAISAIYLTHFVYGLIFPLGYFQKNIFAIPREVDFKNKAYLGG